MKRFQTEVSNSYEKSEQRNLSLALTNHL